MGNHCLTQWVTKLFHNAFHEHSPSSVQPGETVQHAERNLQPPPLIQNKSLGPLSAKKVELQWTGGMTLGFLSVPVMYLTADLLELHSLLLLVYILKGGKATAAFSDCHCDWSTAYHHITFHITAELCTQMDREIITLSAFATFMAWPSDFSFKKFFKTMNLVWKILGWGMLYLYSRVLPWGVSSITELPCWQSAILNKYLESKQAAISWTEPRVTHSCTRADLGTGTTLEHLSES